MLRTSIRIVVAVAVLGLVSLTGAATLPASAASPIWTDISPGAIPPAGERVIIPERSRALAADLEALDLLLSAVPLESVPGAGDRAVIEIPLPDGGFGRFSIVEAPILAPELGARYPEIRTYAGHGLDDPTATIRLDRTPAGFHSQVLSATGSHYIDPYQRDDVRHYQSYHKRDLPTGKSLGGCTVIDPDDGAGALDHLILDGLLRSGTHLRTYRAAVAATGEYTQFHGGTVAAGLAAVTTSMNRVTGIYEREVSIRMQLVPNNHLIIYTNPNTDPYSNNDGYAMLGQNQSNLDSVIGNANYDIGHVFSTGGGGIAYLGVACRTGYKARGVTGSYSPVGDPFDVDYVAHEIGHQYGANHTFNGNAGSCAGGNRNGPTAYEPGSGSTIMAYAGICGSQNLQWRSDDYFHWISIQEIVFYSTQGSGNGCPVITPTGAVEPIIDAGPGGFYIPLGTPFALTATATTTGAPTFCWEEADLGPAGHPNTPSGNAPIFRSFDPVESLTRTFPKLSNLLNNTQTIGEILPSYARNLTFKVTARDVQAGGVGVANDQIAFQVASVGPFLVTYPNTAVTWQGGAQETILWDVAGTNGSPVYCADVDILLSTDGGVTFPTVLAAETPNDGSETITVPYVATSQARIKVAAADNVFFDLSNQNFIIENTVDVAEATVSESGVALYSNHPNPFNPVTTIRFSVPRATAAALRIFDSAGRLVRTLVDQEIVGGTHSVVWDGTDDRGRQIGSGIYLYELKALNETLSGRMTLLK